MKTSILTLVLLLTFSFSFQAQEEKKEQKKEDSNYFIVVDFDGKHRKNLSLLDFLRKDGRFNTGINFYHSGWNGSASGKRTLAMQKVSMNYDVSAYGGSASMNPGRNQIATNRVFIYVDGELVFGNGESWLDKIANVRMKDVKTIARSNEVDTKIYVTLLSDDDLR